MVKGKLWLSQRLRQVVTCKQLRYHQVLVWNQNFVDARGGGWGAGYSKRCLAEVGWWVVSKESLPKQLKKGMVSEGRIVLRGKE